MEHRLIVTSECGYVYYVANGEYIIFHDNNDENEYLGKISRYDDKLFVIGGYRNLSILSSNDKKMFDLYKVDVGVLSESGTVRFIDDFLVILSSSYNSLIFIPVGKDFHELISNISSSKCVVVQLRSHFSLKFNGMDFLDNQFILSLKLQNKMTWDSGVILLDKDFKSFESYKYGWKTSKLAVVDNKVYLLCNNVYGTDKKACLIVDDVPVISFHDSYELNDFSVTDENIYIVGRSIIEIDGTTLNRGVILVFDRDYRLVETYPIRGSGALLGCISFDHDYANDRISNQSTDYIKTMLEEKNLFTTVDIFNGVGWKL